MTFTRDVTCKASFFATRALACRAFVVLAIALLGPSLEAAPQAGHAAPDFVLRTFADGNVRLSEFRGEVVVLNFWAAWCGPCQQELPRLEGLYQRYQRAGLVTLGVNLDDDVGRARDIASRLALSFPLLFDTTKDIGRLYQLDALPLTIFIDREGVIRHVHDNFRNDDDAVYLRQLRELLDE